MNITPASVKRYWWALLPLIPLAGYAIYRNLSPAQKRKFRESVNRGTFGMASALLAQLVEAYRSNQASANEELGSSSLADMAAIPAEDEHETTVGAERW